MLYLILPILFRKIVPVELQLGHSGSFACEYQRPVGYLWRNAHGGDGLPCKTNRDVSLFTTILVVLHG
jgi:hypothetical protein